MTNIRWRKSSYTGAQSNCVELAHTRDQIRDSKDPNGPALAISLSSLLTAVKSDRYHR
ncbi:MAG TPA: DUF397 domain-containing protein [Pseudonocardiaceae bacterium]|jgi:hypothetical protein|nr:DUF397 domain-containing protein [Pseudonocardiaceae bacterium]